MRYKKRYKIFIDVYTALLFSGAKTPKTPFTTQA